MLKISIEKHLVEGEKILGQFENLYATDRRIAIYSKSMVRENFKDLSYPHISSIQTVRKPQWLISVLGIIVIVALSDYILGIIIGLALTVVGFFLRVGHVEISGTGIKEPWIVCNHTYFQGISEVDKDEVDKIEKIIRDYKTKVKVN